MIKESVKKLLAQIKQPYIVVKSRYKRYKKDKSGNYIQFNIILEDLSKSADKNQLEIAFIVDNDTLLNHTEFVTKRIQTALENYEVKNN